MKEGLLQKYFRGECSKEEVQQVESWFSTKEGKEALMAYLENSWDESEPENVPAASTFDAESALNSIHQRIRKENWEEVETYARNRKVRHMHNYVSWSIAAVVALIIGLAYTFYLQPNSYQEEGPTLVYVVKEVPLGQKKKLRLPDGSRVMLNAGSKLWYPQEFAGALREVRLEGEAFFEVTPDPNKPFRVTTGQLNTTVLGTSFNVRAYSDDLEVQVAVATGKVEVSDQAAQQVLLMPGKAATYDTRQGSLSKHAYEQSLLDWKEGRITFRGATLQEVVKTLERWYGVEISLVGAEAQEPWQYYGSFEKQSLTHLLSSIGYVKNFSYERMNNKVTLTFSNPRK